MNLTLNAIVKGAAQGICAVISHPEPYPLCRTLSSDEPVTKRRCSSTSTIVDIMLAAHPAAAGMDIGRIDRKFILLVLVFVVGVGWRSIIFVIVVRARAVGIRLQCEQGFSSLGPIPCTVGGTWRHT